MTSTQSRHWRMAADALAVLRQERQPTRPELGRRLGLHSGPASDLLKRMTRARLVSEQRAHLERRGRPTTTVHAHPAGPLAVVLDLRHGDWRLGTCAVDGVVELFASGRHDGTHPERLLSRLRPRLRALVRSLGSRPVGTGVAVPGPTAEDRLVHATMLGWHDVDLADLAPPPELALIAGNDATMAAVAEARLHHPRPRTLLHIVLEIGIGGALVVDGTPVASALGMHGEFGHLPLGDPGLRCPCGASGCWAAGFDIPHIARRAGVPVQGDPRAWLQRFFTEPHPEPAMRRTRAELAASLGRGIAGLINALDPQIVTLGGLAADLREAAPDNFAQAADAGLMAVHRDRPPPVVAARSDADAAMVGAGLSVFDRVLDAGMLARWASRTPGES